MCVTPGRRLLSRRCGQRLQQLKDPSYRQPGDLRLAIIDAVGHQQCRASQRQAGDELDALAVLRVLLARDAELHRDAHHLKGKVRRQRVKEVRVVMAPAKCGCRRLLSTSPIPHGADGRALLLYAVSNAAADVSDAQQRVLAGTAVVDANHVGSRGDAVLSHAHGFDSPKLCRQVGHQLETAAKLGL